MNKMIRTYLLASSVIFLCGNTIAQCGATSVYGSPQPIMICEGDSTQITFTPSGTCVGNYEFEVLDGATVMQAWSTLPTYFASPIVNTTYTVNVRCNACPAIVVSDTFSVDVTGQPTVTGNLTICSGSTTTLDASGSTGNLEWWDNFAGGTQLSATASYTTPPLNSDVTYWVHASGSSGSGGGSILITECGLDGAIGGTGSEDYVEISNLYTVPMNTSGWICAVSNSYTNINTFNNIFWNLPANFPPCSVLTKTDASSQPNYWGNNIFWNSTSASWTIVIDDVGNVVDFIAWGWTAAQLAAFNPTINGFSISLGTEWIGDGCALPCGSTGGVQYSFARIGNTDNNENTDFVCQPTSVNLVNPLLSCGWISSATCPYPVTVVVDTPPTASNPAPINVACIADVPVPDVTVVDDEADDFTPVPIVAFVSDVSDGMSCPEKITRTYSVTDTCGNFIDVEQIITIHDLVPPVLVAPSPDLLIECQVNVPAMANLIWTDNCDGTGSVVGVDVSDGNLCPEIIIRTWTYTDGCGNVASDSREITINDITPPVASNPPNEQVTVLPGPDPLIIIDETDNCSVPTVSFVNDVTDGGFCPELITRTYSVIDDCGNETLITQVYTLGDPIPNASFVASSTDLTNLATAVDFTNTSSGAVSYIWNFGDESPFSSEVDPSHLFPDGSSANFLVELIAFSPFGCSDTVRMVIKIREELIYFIANSFTPNGDEINQTFQPVFVSGFDPFDYVMTIYNRWGEVIFETHDVDRGWDGTYGGEIVPDGSYLWKIVLKLSDVDDRQMITGHVNIFK